MGTTRSDAIHMYNIAGVFPIRCAQIPILSVAAFIVCDPTASRCGEHCSVIGVIFRCRFNLCNTTNITRADISDSKYVRDTQKEHFIVCGNK